VHSPALCFVFVGIAYPIVCIIALEFLILSGFLGLKAAKTRDVIAVSHSLHVPMS